jgi:hypothetical protein
MPNKGLSAQLLGVAAYTLLVDQLTAEVSEVLADAGVDCILVKGPVIGEWLYPGEVRGYGDSDLLVAESKWSQATAALLEHGFQDKWASMDHPRMASSTSTSQREFVRGSENVDLHCTLPGLEAPAEEVWNSLWQGAGAQNVGGRSIRVPDHPALLLHLTLHAAHHHDELKPLSDLRRGIETAGVGEWRQAAELAEKLGGLAAFASGLRRLPKGEQLARTLEVDDCGSVQFDLRLAGVPTAESLHDLLAPGLTIAQRGALLRAELFPQPSFMRWWVPVARRGNRGLLASYPLRWMWLAVKVPRGLVELRRARRRRAGMSEGQGGP